MKNGLHELFMDELSDMYDAEQQLVKALPKLVKAAQNDELRDAFETHLKETENHVNRLEKVFGLMDQTPKRKKCEGMKGVVDESKEMIEEHKGSEESDAALI